MKTIVTTKALSTSDLFAATHAALTQGRFSQGRALLDDLGLRNDNKDLLPSAEAYKVPETIREMIQDRIDLVNSKAKK